MQWLDLLKHNAYAHECLRPEFGGLEGGAGDWHVGDASHWSPDRADIPAWFEPGDDLISWGHTGNGDFLFWRVKPGVAPNDWPVAFKEEGPYWEYYESGFCVTTAGLLNGDLQSEYLSDCFGDPHSYDR